MPLSILLFLRASSPPSPLGVGPAPLSKPSGFARALHTVVRRARCVGTRRSEGVRCRESKKEGGQKVWKEKRRRERKRREGEESKRARPGRRRKRTRSARPLSIARRRHTANGTRRGGRGTARGARGFSSPSRFGGLWKGAVYDSGEGRDVDVGGRGWHAVRQRRKRPGRAWRGSRPGGPSSRPTTHRLSEAQGRGGGGARVNMKASEREREEDKMRKSESTVSPHKTPDRDPKTPRVVAPFSLSCIPSRVAFLFCPPPPPPPSDCAGRRGGMAERRQTAETRRDRRGGGGEVGAGKKEVRNRGESERGRRKKSGPGREWYEDKERSEKVEKRQGEGGVGGARRRGRGRGRKRSEESTKRVVAKRLGLCRSRSFLSPPIRSPAPGSQAVGIRGRCQTAPFGAARRRRDMQREKQKKVATGRGRKTSWWCAGPAVRDECACTDSGGVAVSGATGEGGGGGRASRVA